jgi:predicted dehydrogenase
MKNDGPLKVAVIGVGHLGQHHARIYAEHPDVELVAVVDRDLDRAREIATRHKARAIADYKELEAVPDLAAVSIAVPTVAHYELADYFLNRGVHCLVEKPITNTVVHAAALVSLAKQKKLILQVGHIERFNAAVQRLRELVTRPGFIEAHRLGPFNPRVKDVGVVLDLMIHDIDIVLQIVNSPVLSVEAIGVPIFTEKEDIGNARIRFENGCIANLTVSRVTPKQTRKLRIFQRDTYISINYAEQSMEVYRRTPVKNPAPGEPNWKIVHKMEKLVREEPLKKELDHFLDCVRHGEQPQVTGEHGMSALEIAIEVTRQIREAQEKNPVMRESLAEDSSTFSGEFVGYAPDQSVPSPEAFAAADIDDEEEG